MKKNLLTIVKNILSKLDSEDVNSIDDSIEALQIADIVESVYEDMLVTRDVPEHEGLIKLTALSDPSFPTHFSIPTNVTGIQQIWYDVSSDSSFEYREIRWKEPLDFLRMIDGISSDYTSVLDKNGNTNLRIVNNKQPHYYTSFDDFYIVMDSHDSSIDTTLQESKVRAYATTYPVFQKIDSYVPDLDSDAFPYLEREATSQAFELLKGGTTPKVEQAARRTKNTLVNNKYRIERENRRPDYGRN